MHQWGDENVDWKGIDEVCDYIAKYSRRYGLIGGQIKEKWGTIRWYAHFGHLSLHSIIYPGYVYSQFPNWLWKLDCNYIGPILRLFFEKAFVKWQTFIYNRIYQNCLKKWPHLRAEILIASDYPELIQGAIRIEETENEIRTVILGWNTEEIGARIRNKLTFT